MHYEDFLVQIHPPRDDDHPVTVHCSAGDGSGTFRLPPSGELAARPGGSRRAAAGGLPAGGGGREVTPVRPPPSERLEEVGAVLFDALFTDVPRRLLAESLARLPQDGEHALRIKLALDPELLQVARLPWEAVYWKERREFLNLGRTTSLVRYLNVPRGARPRLTTPLRVLLASACPLGVAGLDLETEAARIHEALRGIPGVEVRWLRHATAQGIRDLLLAEPCHVFHFMGHGNIDASSGEGELWLEDGARGPARLPGRVVAHLLRDSASLRLAFLNACSTAAAREENVDPFAGVAAALVSAGIPAVLAMRLSVSDAAAAIFSTAFYRRIAAGDPVDAATTEGRMAILLAAPESPEWATPALFLRSWDGRLFEPEHGGRKHLGGAGDGSAARNFSALVQAKTRGFVGRGWVFDAIARFVRDKGHGYFVIRGEPGIGKTALIAEMVRRERSIHHFNVAGENIRAPEQFLTNVCAQLVATYGLDVAPLPPGATDGARFLRLLLSKVAGRLQPAERALLLVDALDESDLSLLAPGENALCLPTSLPEGVCIVLTTREKDVPLRIDDELVPLDLREDRRENLADIREYVEVHLPRPGVRGYLARLGLDESTFVAEMVEKSQGNFMYLRHVLPEIEGGAYQTRELSRLPAGLANYYEDHWRRMRAADEVTWFQRQLPVLVALTVVHEPISMGLIGRFSGLGDRRQVRQVLEDWSQFLNVTEDVGAAGKPRKRYSLYHASFADFIRAKDQVLDERVSLEAADRRVDAGLGEP